MRKRNKRGQFQKKSRSAAPRRRRRHARAAVAAPAAAAPRRRRRRSRAAAAAPRRRHRRARAASNPVHHRRHRRRHARSNPMSGGEMALSIISAGIGWAVADFTDRYLATYDPSVAVTGTPAYFTGGNGTMANTLNIAMAPSMLRIGVGIGIPLLTGVGAYVIKNSLGRAALQGMTIGAGVKIFATLWNTYVMGNLLKPAAGANPTTTSVLGLRLYPAEMTAAQIVANSPQTLASPFNPGLARPPALAAKPQGLADAGPFAAPTSSASPVAPSQPAGAPQLPSKPDEDCGCLGDKLPAYLGFLSDAA